jgi:hypothetical protein
MPGKYEVRDRNLMEGCLGLKLPFPKNATGRFMLPLGSADLLLVEMAPDPTCGTVDSSGLYNAHKGIWTQSISDCVVVVIAERDDADRRWTNFCFHHMLGGAMTHTLPGFKKLNPTRARCWAVVADKSSLLSRTTDPLVDELVKWGVPRTQIGTYKSGGSFTFGFRFEGGYLGEVKPPYVPK